MSTKMLFILPFAVTALAGCAASNGQAPQANAACAELTGAAYLECQQNVAPAARSTLDDGFKMVKPKARASGNFGAMGS